MSGTVLLASARHAIYWKGSGRCGYVMRRSERTGPTSSFGPHAHAEYAQSDAAGQSLQAVS